MSFLSWGSTPHRTDTVNTLLKRIALGVEASTSGGGSGGPGIVGTVDPEGVVTAPPGTTYLNTANETLWVKHSGTGNTGWTPNLV